MGHGGLPRLGPTSYVSVCCPTIRPPGLTLVPALPSAHGFLPSLSQPPTITGGSITTLISISSPSLEVWDEGPPLVKSAHDGEADPSRHLGLYAAKSGV
eukprot:2154888-Rhodomonas_salina.1